MSIINCALAVRNSRTALEQSNGVMLVGLSECLLLVDLNNLTNHNIGMIKSTDFAYAAGYFDGDGCFYIGKILLESIFKFRYSIIIHSTEIENLQWFQKTFGGILSTRRFDSKQKPLHRFVVKGKSLSFFKGIEEFLIEKIDEFYTFEKFRNPDFRDQRDSLILEMDRLKNHSNLIPQSIKQEVESIRNTIIPNDNDFAYLAGFIDAECCLNINKSHPKGKPNPTYKILLQCNNTKSHCFKWLCQRFGGQFHFIDRSKFNTPHRNQMCWRLSAASLAKILPKIHPFLNHKKPVCEELMNFTKTMIPLTGMISRNSPAFAEFYKPILDERERIFHKIQALNKKGV
jgi:hypothetical protein